MDLKSRLARVPRYVRIITILTVILSLIWIFSLPRDLFEGVPYSTVVTDRNGELLGARIADDGQWRFPECDSLPSKYVAALIEFEDRGFRHHIGISLRAMARAIVQNIRSGHVVSGASTISMQLIRMAGHKKRTLWNKLAEVFLATRLEARYTKDEILALYASHAPFGGNVVGLEAAAWRYLGRGLDEMSWAEAATFAILPNAPSSINLAKNREELLAKRNRLLKRLAKRGYLSEADYRLSIEEPLIGEIHPLPSHAPHLVEEYNATKHGMYCKTGIDIYLQQNVENITDRWCRELRRDGINDVAAIVMDVRTMSIVAYCGNADTEFERPGVAVDIAKAPRSTGSILKPLLYCAALQDGVILPHTLLPDVPTNFGGFSPKNYDLSYCGAVPASEALAKSLNIPNVWLLKQYGTARFCRALKEAGMTTLTRPSDSYGLSLILGGAEARLSELVTIYTSIASSYQGFTTESKFSDQASVWYMLEAMSEVGRPDEIDWHRLSSARQVAWKTGTSYGARDAWAIGITPDYVVGVWAGNANGQGSPNLAGATTAGPIMFDLLNLLPQTQWFAPPQDTDLQEVCAQSGFLAGKHCKEKTVMPLPHKSTESKICPYHNQAGEFVLPPAMASYYRQRHPEYKVAQKAGSDNAAMQFIYPTEGSVLSAARQIGGELAGITFSLAHRRSNATVFWHLDNEYLGETSDIHKIQILPSPGIHTITAVDEEGASAKITVRII